MFQFDPFHDVVSQQETKMNPTMIYLIDQNYMKPSEKTSEIKHYILHDEVQ
jgi:hypothetical protein